MIHTYIVTQESAKEKKEKQRKIGNTKSAERGREGLCSTIKQKHPFPPLRLQTQRMSVSCFCFFSPSCYKTFAYFQEILSIFSAFLLLLKKEWNEIQTAKQSKTRTLR